MSKTEGKLNGTSVQLMHADEVIAEVTDISCTIDKDNISERTSESFTVLGTIEVTVRFWIDRTKDVLTQALSYITRFRN